jgi:site-specific recombinase XerD
MLDTLPALRRPKPYVFQRHDDLVDATVPGGDRDHWSIGSILGTFPSLPNWPSPDSRHRYGARARITTGGRTILEWLQSHPGNGWQERWINSGADSGTEFLNALVAKDTRSPTTARTELSAGLGSLLLCRLVFPSYRFLSTYNASALYAYARQVFRADLFAQLEAKGGQLTMPLSTIRQALVVISKLVLHTGRDVDQLTAEDMLTFRAWMLRHRKGGTSVLGLRPAWVLLHGVADLGEHPTLTDAVRFGQRPTEELVDNYLIRCEPIREVLIAYLNERRPALDYNSFSGLISRLVGNFWADIERHHPAIDTLDLPSDVANAWKERAKTYRGKDGNARPRKDYHFLYVAVRAFYRDLQEWAHDDPFWANWSFASPVRKSDLGGQVKAKKQTTAAMHQRVRERLPHLPTLIDAAEQYKDEMAALHESASSTAMRETFTFNERRYQRTAPEAYETNAYYRDSAPPLQIQDLATGEVLDVGQAEHDAFWAWATIEVLRHTGVRIEELLEVTHLALISYRLPDTGEVVPMLQIVPSKSNEERLLLVGPELASVLATIISRLRGLNGGSIPLTRRYDGHEHTVGPALPHLFQHKRHGWKWAVPSPATIYKLLDQVLARASLATSDGEPLHYRPHDFRRMFATEAVTGGLPVHIVARLLGHANINTTQAYMAIFDEELVRSYRAFLDHRRAVRPEAEYREPTEEEWREFQQHFQLRKLELGECGRPYGTPCKHEHACIRCPSLRLDPAARPRLVEIIANLNDRIVEAKLNGWFGEVAGLNESLQAAARKLVSLDRMRDRQPTGPVDLGIPVIT